MSEITPPSFEALLALGPDPAVAAALHARFAQDAAALVVDFGGLHGQTERLGPAMALLLHRAAERAFTTAFEVHEPRCTVRQGSSLFAAFTRPEAAIMAALDGLLALADFNRGRVESLSATVGLGFGELLMAPEAGLWGGELDRAALLAHAGATGLVLATGALMDALDEPPPGVGLHQAPADKVAALGLRFFVVRDYRD